MDVIYPCEMYMLIDELTLYLESAVINKSRQSFVLLYLLFQIQFLDS